jgi:Domain of unknown function (DUF1707)
VPLAITGFPARYLVAEEAAMATGPGDEPTAAGRDRLRAGHAGREQVIGTLQAAFVQGMLTKDEFDLRVGQALAARTYAALAALTADLPAGLAAAQPPEPARAQGGEPVPRPGRVFTAGTVVYAGVWLVAFALPDSGPDHDSSAGIALVTTATFFYIFFALMFGTQILSDWLDKRSGRQLPRGPAPGAGGQASRRPPSAGPGRQLPPADPGHRHTGEAAPIRRPRPPRRGHFLRRQYATN